MATSIDPQDLGRLCFRKTPNDVIDRDVVLAALWHLHRRAVEIGGRVDSTFKSRHLGQAAGLRTTDYRAALDELVAAGQVHQDPRGMVSMTSAGYRAARGIIDVDRALAA